MVSGWLLAGFSDELPGEIIDLELGTQPVLLLRDDSGLRAFDGVCPHRGARLARGGRLAGGRIICPFHGHHIRLGMAAPGDPGLFVAGFPAFEIAELVFVHLGAADGAPDCGFAEAIAALKASHVFVHGFSMKVPVSPRLVIENAFDTGHFSPVHGVPHATPLTIAPFDAGAGLPFTAHGRFAAAASPWDPEPDGTPITIDYQARAYGPGLIVSSQLGRSPYHFLVGATPDACGGAVVRLVLMLPRSDDGEMPPDDRVEWLLSTMEQQLTADRSIWAGLPADPPRRLQPGEDSIAAFWSFCDHFPDIRGHRPAELGA